MERRYSKELLDKLVERQETIMIKGAEVLVKNLPDSDEKGAMDPRLYKDMKNHALYNEIYAEVFDEDGYFAKRN